MIEALKVWIRNFRNRATAKAYRQLTQAMADDQDFAHSWKCNIAMPIYDSLTGTDHRIKHAAANQIADRLMQHLFGVDTSKQ